MDFAINYRNKIINHIFRNTSFSPPATVYVALFTSSTGLSANNPTGEVTGGGYARKAVTFAAPSGSGDTLNSAEVRFDEATVDWGIITHFALVSHASATNWGTGVDVIMWDAVRNAAEEPFPRNVLETDVVIFSSGKIKIEVR
jgi:hypothetical protein